MNLSCSGGGLPESGCLFFKVGGLNYVTNGKNMNVIVSHLINILIDYFVHHSKVQLHCTRNTLRFC